jgi:hypothetical protein
MTSILDRIRSGATGLFAGPMIPGQQGPDPGARQGLISAGLATIIGANQGANPLEALAMGAMQGQQAGGVARQDYLNRQTRAQLQDFLAQNGYDRGNLTSAAFQLLTAGDLEGAKGVFNVLQSLPSQSAAPTLDISFQTINGRRMQVSSDRATGEIVRQTDLGPAPDDNFYERTTEITFPDGKKHLVGIRRGTGEQIDLGISGDGESGGTGTYQERAAAIRASSALQDVNAAFGDPRLRQMVAGTFAEMAASGGALAAPVGNWVLGKLAPGTQTSAAARDRVAALVQNIMSGAQMSNQERGYYRQAYTPARGDIDDTNEGKRAAVTFMLQRVAAMGLDPENINPDELTDEQKVQIAQIARDAGRQSGAARDYVPEPTADEYFKDIPLPGVTN